jgi:hypothetical protein
MKTDPINRFLMEARACAMQMMQNGAYIQEELPSLTMPDALRQSLQELCANLISTKHDIIHEIHEADDLLKSDPDSGLLDLNLTNIRNWILESVGEMNQGVEAIQRAVTEGQADGILFMLVAESAMNVLHTLPAFPESSSGEADSQSEEEALADFDEDEDGEDGEEDGYDPNCYAFYSEDSYPVGTLIKAIRGLMDRPELTEQTTDNLKVFLFAMERLPLVTPGVHMSLGLRLDQGGESAWIEIRMGDGEFSLGRGTWIDGDADTETVFEVTPDYREGDAFLASQFAESFTDCARDVCREVVIEDWSDGPFTAWELKPDAKRWGSLRCSFL